MAGKLVSRLKAFRESGVEGCHVLQRVGREGLLFLMLAERGQPGSGRSGVSSGDQSTLSRPLQSLSKMETGSFQACFTWLTPWF